jgi:hypothetical protein
MRETNPAEQGEQAVPPSKDLKQFEILKKNDPGPWMNVNKHEPSSTR